jgi:hypothetical protein
MGPQCGVWCVSVKEPSKLNIDVKKIRGPSRTQLR